MIDLSSDVLAGCFKSPKIEEVNILAHIATLAPESVTPYNSADAASELKSGHVRQLAAAHRAGYVLLSAASCKLNDLIHSFMRWQEGTLDSEAWKSTGIDLFSVHEDAFPEVLQQLHEMTKECGMQPNWQAVRRDMERIVAGGFSSEDAKTLNALSCAQEMCDKIISEVTTLPVLQSSSYQERLEKLKSVGFPAFMENVKNSYHKTQWFLEQLWPLTKEVADLFKGLAPDDLKVLVTDVWAESGEKKPHLNWSALKGKCEKLKNSSEAGRLAAALCDLIKGELAVAITTSYSVVLDRPEIGPHMGIVRPGRFIRRAGRNRSVLPRCQSHERMHSYAGH